MLSMIGRKSWCSCHMNLAPMSYSFEIVSIAIIIHIHFSLSLIDSYETTRDNLYKTRWPIWLTMTIIRFLVVKYCFNSFRILKWNQDFNLINVLYMIQMKLDVMFIINRSPQARCSNDSQHFIFCLLLL